MSIQDIEQATLDLIRKFSNYDYTGPIKVSKLNPIGYEIILYPQGQYVPMVFYAELEDDKFLKYLREEIRTKKFHLSQYGVLNKRERETCYPINKSCNCK